MADKLMLLGHPKCGYCVAMKEKLKDKIESGAIGVIDASTDEGLKIAMGLGIKGVPDCVAQKEDGTYQKCDLEELLKV